MEIIGNTVFLKRLTESDVSQSYVNWLNDSEINQYLECIFSYHTIDTTKLFIRNVLNDNNFQFGIFDNITQKHIGNIKLGDINNYHKSADIGFIIGEKSYWGKGIATESIKLVLGYAFRSLNLFYLWGGVYSPNIGSIRVFEKSGFSLEGTQRSKYVLNSGQRVDGLLYAITKDDYESRFGNSTIWA